MYLFLCLCLMACSDENTTPEPVSTVDSNLAEPNDTMLPELYMDDAINDSNINIALDSTGRTILPNDTNYIKQ